MAKSTEAGPWWSRSRVLGHPTPPKCLWGTSVPHVQQMTCMGFSQPLEEFWTVIKSKVGLELRNCDISNESLPVLELEVGAKNTDELSQQSR